MKKALTCLVILVITQEIFAQTNTFPSSGSVGIGTTSPTSTLHLYGTQSSPSTTANTSIFNIHSSSGVQLTFGAQSTSPYTSWLQTKDYTNGGNYYPLSFNPMGGNVGIGITAPGAKVESRGTAINGLANFQSAASGNAPLLVSTGDYVANDIVAFDFGANNRGSVARIGALMTGSGSYMLFGTSNTYSGISNTAMAIDYSGNVGIGITAPGAKVESRGTAINGLANFQSAASGNAPLLVSTGDYVANDIVAFDFGANNRGSVARIGALMTGSGSYMLFGTSNTYSGITNTAMAIDYSGKVGIGITSPTEKLSVEGNIYANGNISSNGFITTKKLTVTQTGWSDYVFNKDYKLRTLQQVEAFINENNHLPEIPSAKEVEEKGINVGDNQALLLTKIEELTLYVIDLQKQVTIQAKEIKGMKHKK